MKARISAGFTVLFLNSIIGDEENLGKIESDFHEDDVIYFRKGDEVEVLKVIPADGYDRPHDSYVIFHKETNESITISEIYLEF